MASVVSTNKILEVTAPLKNKQKLQTKFESFFPKPYIPKYKQNLQENLNLFCVLTHKIVFFKQILVKPGSHFLKCPW